MEFFRIINRQATEEKIQELIRPKLISDFSESMMFVNGKENEFSGLTLWGEFNISYNKIKGGVRFTLINCPYAFNWTVTYGYSPEREKIVLHCTINRTRIKDDFHEEIEEFLNEWQIGLESKF